MNTIRTILLAGFILFLGFTGCVSESVDQPLNSQLYMDTALSAAERAENLLSLMDLQDKVGQMTQVARDYLVSQNDITTYRLGSILSGGGSSPFQNTVAGWQSMINGMQDKALATPLGIPLIYGTDAVHGHNNLEDATIFPHHIGLGAANNSELVREIGRITAIESIATGVRWNFAPCLTVPQDIRWGRTYEGYSSDPAIVTSLGVAETLGIQYGLGTDNAMLACIKHYVADGATVGGVDRGNAIISNETLMDIHMAPYLPALDAGAKTVMASFSKINGVFNHTNSELLTDYLKGELGFEGFVVSDWAALKQLPGSSREQIKSGINAGIDMVMVPDNYRDFIKDLMGLVTDGEIPMDRIDDAVYRILKVKFEMGLFEHPYANNALADTVGSAEHRAVAREAVAQSQVLLKNDSVLPLGPTGRYLVIGEGGDDIGIQSGGWTLTWQGEKGNRNQGHSIVDAFTETVGADNVDYVRNLASLDGQIQDGYSAIVFVVSEDPYAEMKGDNRRPAISSADLRILAKLAETDSPVVLLIVSGRPLILDGAEQLADVLVACWLPGTEGLGITDVLFGAKPFTGKLPFHWPADERGLTQNLRADEYLYPRGFGLVE